MPSDPLALALEAQQRAEQAELQAADMHAAACHWCERAKELNALVSDWRFVAILGWLLAIAALAVIVARWM